MDLLAAIGRLCLFGGDGRRRRHLAIWLDTEQLPAPSSSEQIGHYAEPSSSERIGHYAEPSSDSLELLYLKVFFPPKLIISNGIF